MSWRSEITEAIHRAVMRQLTGQHEILYSCIELSSDGSARGSDAPRLDGKQEGGLAVEIVKAPLRVKAQRLGLALTRGRAQEVRMRPDLNRFFRLLSVGKGPAALGHGRTAAALIAGPAHSSTHTRS